MPSLIRFVLILGALAALIYAGVYYLANEVKIAPHEITQSVDLPKAAK